MNLNKLRAADSREFDKNVPIMYKTFTMAFKNEDSVERASKGTNVI
jgi:hypothetical protein